jgi:hypothetical protein
MKAEWCWPAASSISSAGGRLSGRIYRMVDSDGSGCGPNLDEGGRIVGATCTHNGHECASLSCEHGCMGGRDNCHCTLRSIVAGGRAPAIVR